MNKVILVEDEIYARQGLRNLIDWNGLGYEVSHEADNGEEALQIIEQFKPELVITDIRMPVLDGMELIRSVRESGNSDTKFIIISGYGDFKYAQQAIKFDVKDFILKPIDETELTETLSGLAQLIEKDKQAKHEQPALSDRALERLLKGRSTEQDIGLVTKQLGWERKGKYGCLLAEINGYFEDIDTMASAEWRRDLSLIIDRTTAEFGLGKQACHLVELKPGLFGILLDFGKAPGTLGMAEVAERFARRLRQRFSLPIMLYAGEFVQDLNDLQSAYRTAGETMAYKYAFAGRQALSYEEMRHIELRYEEFEQADYSRLLEQMEEGERDAMRLTVEWIFDQIQVKRYAPEAVQNAIARYVFGIIGSIRSMQGDENVLKSLEPVLQWNNQSLTLEELKDRFCALVEESADLTTALRKNNAKGDIAKIKAFIEQHYNEDISLKSIAARYYMNPVYLGQLFKKTYGLYFNDFLLQIRIHNAKRLLRQTEKRVYEIASQVGFDNSDYFVCKFEKVEGRTPTAYRNELIAK